MSTHELDPEGDAIIHLDDANAPFAPWSPSHAPSSHACGPAAPKTQCDKRPEGAPPACTFRVSSRHLALASKVFEAAFGGRWSERERQSDGLRHMEATEWDAEAFELVLNIVHGHNRKVPRHLPLETLAKVAVVVDYYQLQEAVEVYGSMWIERLRGEIPKVYCRDLVLWICISSVFAEQGILKETASVAVCTGGRDFQTLGLPIPVELAGKITNLRKQALEAVALQLRTLRDGLLDGRLGCSQPCQALRLGTLEMQLYAFGHVALDSPEPFEDHSLSSVDTRLATLDRVDQSRNRIRYCCPMEKDARPIYKGLRDHMRRHCSPGTISWETDHCTLPGEGSLEDGSKTG